MGIYIINSLHSNWFKLGHHQITEKRPNVYYRYINRGFYSVKNPDEIKDKVGFNDLKLLYWYPNMNIEDENNIHTLLKNKFESFGEWYRYENLGEVINIITNEYGGVLDMPTIDDYNKAKKWSDDINRKYKKISLR